MYSTSEFRLVTFQALNSYTWQVVTTLGSVVKISQTEGKEGLVLNYYLMFSYKSNLKPPVRLLVLCVHEHSKNTKKLYH